MGASESPVKVFISWSGQASQSIARALSQWLPDLMDHLEFWFSSDDLRTGQRWSVEVAKALNECDVGILVITPDNMLSPWLTFEAGALSKNANEARVTPYLVGVAVSSLVGPLSQFQAVAADHAGTFRLVMDLAQLRCAASAVPAVGRRFEKFWPEFEKTLLAVQADQPTRPSEERAIELLRDQVSDLGQLVRQLVATSSPPTISPLIEHSESESVPLAIPAEVYNFVGAWQVDNGSHVYVRVVNGQLVAPYCYMGNHELTGVYSGWHRVSDYWFTRFEWVDGTISGFGFYRLEGPDRVAGQWWMSDESSQEVITAPPSKAGVRAIWTRLSDVPVPAWAEQYFTDLSVLP